MNRWFQIVILPCKHPISLDNDAGIAIWICCTNCIQNYRGRYRFLIWAPIQMRERRSATRVISLVRGRYRFLIWAPIQTSVTCAISLMCDIPLSGPQGQIQVFNLGSHTNMRTKVSDSCDIPCKHFSTLQ